MDASIRDGSGRVRFALGIYRPQFIRHGEPGEGAKSGCGRSVGTGAPGRENPLLKMMLAGLIGSVAVVEDLTYRRISNWIPVSACVGGTALQCADLGWCGTGLALSGTLAGASVFLLLYILGGMGGGDIRLMSGFGAILGPQGILQASLWSAACGGLLAVLWLRLGKLAGRYREKFRPNQDVPDRMESFPYAPAIAIGVWITLNVTG